MKKAHSETRWRWKSRVGERNRLVQHLTLKAQNIACDVPCFLVFSALFYSFSFSSFCSSPFLITTFSMNVPYYLIRLYRSLSLLPFFHRLLPVSSRDYQNTFHCSSLFSLLFDIRFNIHTLNKNWVNTYILCGNRIIPTNFSVSFDYQRRLLIIYK